jgi:hypothetical protein
VTIDPSMTRGVAFRFVLEIMDRTDASQRTVSRELGEAKLNRAAVTAIAVLSSKDTPAAGGQALRILSNDRLLCVLDLNEWNTLPLETAYLWARTEILRAAGAVQSTGMNLTSAAEALDEAVGHLNDFEKLQTKLAVGRGGLLDAEALISEIEANVTRCLAKASAILRPTLEPN